MSTMGSYPWPEATVFAATAVYARALHEAHRDRCEALVPELVEALRDLLAQLDGACGVVIPAGSFSSARKAARAALAKAEGKDTST